ncbi:uncharacterized protein ISCGN_002432 [Ixodes scapularis]
MVYCCVPFGKSERGKAVGVSFHEFPTTRIRDEWIKAVSRKGAAAEVWFPSDRSVVCSLHFKDEDYRSGLKQKRLKADAVPSTFPGYPTYLKSTQKKPRRVLKRTSDESQNTAHRKRKRMDCPLDDFSASTVDEVQPQESESSQILRQVQDCNTQVFTVPPIPVNIQETRHTPSVPCQTVLTSRKLVSLQKQLKTLKRKCIKLQSAKRVLKEEVKALTQRLEKAEQTVKTTNIELLLVSYPVGAP